MLLAGLQLSATTYYVSPSGDDGNDGLGPDTALKSFSAGLAKVNRTSGNDGGELVLLEGRHEIPAVISASAFAPNVTVRGATSDASLYILDGGETTKTPMLSKISYGPVTFKNFTIAHYRASKGVYPDATCLGIDWQNCVFKDCGAADNDQLMLVVTNGVTVSGCTFEGNQRGNTGGAYCAQVWSGGVVSNTVFRNCSRGHNLAAPIYLYDGGIVSNCRFEGNVLGMAGGVHMFGGVLSGCRFETNELAMVSPAPTQPKLRSAGCVVYANDDPAVAGVVTNCQFLSNVSTHNVGGALVMEANGVPSGLTVTDCIVSNTQAQVETLKGLGVGFYCAQAESVDCRLVRCKFIENACDGDGGAVYSTAAGLVLDGCVFKDNSSALGRGGAVYATSPCITNCTFTSNSATVGGAVVLLTNGVARASVLKCLFEGNRAFKRAGAAANAEGYAGALSVATLGGSKSAGSFGGQAEIVDCSFVSNTADADGGALLCGWDSTLVGMTVDRCVFKENKAANDGGAVFVRTKNTANPLEIRNSLFASNAATRQGGGAWFATEAVCTIWNCTFASNVAAGKNTNTYSSPVSAAILCSWNGSRLKNCILYDNQVVFGDVSEANTSNCCFAPESSESSAGNGTAGVVRADPLFVDAANGDYSLMRQSPIRDKGVSAAWMTEPGAADLAGKPRVVGECVDIGAYEFRPQLGMILILR